MLACKRCWLAPTCACISQSVNALDCHPHAEFHVRKGGLLAACWFEGHAPRCLASADCLCHCRLGRRVRLLGQGQAHAPEGDTRSVSGTVFHCEFALASLCPAMRFTVLCNAPPASCSAQPITACAWNPTGDLFAYTASYDWSKGSEGATTTPPQLFIQHTLPEDVRPPPAQPATAGRR